MKKKLRFKKTLICMLLGLIAVTSSCVDEKNLYDPDLEFPNPIEEIQVPDGFDWKTMNSMEMEVIVDDKFNGEYNYLIEVFDANPIIEEDAVKISSGLATGNSPWNGVITVPQYFESLFVRQTTPDGLSSVRAVEVTGSSVVCNFANSVLSRAANAGVITRSDITYPEVDSKWFPTEASADATPLVSGQWQSTPGNYTITGNFSLSLSNTDLSNLYVIGDTEMAFDKNKNRHFYVLPGRTLTFTGDTSFGQDNILVSVGEGAKLVFGGDIKPSKGTIIYNKGTVEIVGTGESELTGTVEIHNLPGANMILNGDMKLSGSTAIYNQGSINTKKNIHTVGTSILYNKGEIDIVGELYSDTKSQILNDAELTCGSYMVTSSVSTGDGATMVNNGIVTIKGETKFEGGGSKWHNNATWITDKLISVSYNDNYINSCRLIVNDLLELKQTRFTNDAGSFISTKDMHLENTRINMYSESFINATGNTFVKGNSINGNQGIYGVGEKRALVRMIKVTADEADSQHIYYSGNLQVACSDHPAEYQNGANASWVLADGAEWADYNTNTVSIPKSECNDGWNPETNPPVDPTPDPDINPYTYSYMFEDMWPFYGDYDMNDVVLRVKDITYYIDADNLVSKFSFEASLRAVGAEKRIAGALMLDKIQASAVSSVSYSLNTPTTFNVLGSGVEQNQTNAVVPLFDEAHLFMMGREGAWYINTNPAYPEDNVANPPEMTVTVEFTNPVNKSDLNVISLNFFIVTDINTPGKSVRDNSRREIHIIDYQPTDRAETSIFGNHNDNSGQERYYVSKQNLAWGIVIPDVFRWPTEHTKIQDAYSEFEGWVTSGGKNNTEWYNNPTSGAVY